MRSSRKFKPINSNSVAYLLFRKKATYSTTFLLQRRKYFTSHKKQDGC